MKSLSMIILLFITPIVVIGQNLKALDDKNGFREAKFGMSPSSFKKLEQLKGYPLVGFDDKSDINTRKLIPLPGQYYDKDVDLHIGDFSLDYVKYGFYKNKLLTIKIMVSEGLTNQNGILEILETAYGKGVLKKEDGLSSYSNKSYSYYIWEGEKVKMTYILEHDFYSPKPREIMIINKELMNWEEADRPIEAQKGEQRQKQAIQEAAKKL
jgi:hypothetical protein